MGEVLALLYSFFGTIVYTLVVFIASMFIHELGHLYNARKIDKTAYIKLQLVGNKLTVQTHWLKSNRELNRKIYQAGVRWGFFFILFVSVFNWYALFVLIPYLVGCKSDLEMMESLKL